MRLIPDIAGDGVRRADVVIEAIFENLQAKRELFARVEAAAKPDAIFAFYPGGAGIQFVTQYAQSGLKGQVPLYTAFTVDSLSLPRQGDLALGVPGAQEWVNDLPNAANKKFVAAYEEEYKAVARFFATAQPILDGEVILVTAYEISAR